MDRKTAALMVMLILLAGAFFVTSDQPLCGSVVALGDPIPGRGGGGGDRGPVVPLGDPIPGGGCGGGD